MNNEDRDTESTISPQMEDYLERIYTLQLEKKVVRVKDISALMQVRMPSVNNAIAMLKRQNLVTQEPYGHIEITAEGIELAEKIVNRHKVLTDFFISLGVSPDVAERDACAVEHIISEETFIKIQEQLR
ncbi:MAG: metal-dependent transcriptional regulator [Deferribacteraceae bacterium]|jgi:Mn-dependent DtxR family transcriptional regulator|nr:metal-dependent transcriptional regulator [Deferribacteraceae bacterium]